VTYLQDRSVYEERYDSITVELCRIREELVTDTLGERPPLDSDGQADLENGYYTYSIFYFQFVESLAGERWQTREAKIRQWMGEDQAKDQRLASRHQLAPDERRRQPQARLPQRSPESLRERRGPPQAGRQAGQGRKAAGEASSYAWAKDCIHQSGGWLYARWLSLAYPALLRKSARMGKNLDGTYEADLANYLKALGQNIRRLRREVSPRLSQERLADVTGLHRTEIGKLQQGKVDPRLMTLHRVALAFDVTLDDLARGLPAPPKRDLWGHYTRDEDTRDRAPRGRMGGGRRRDSEQKGAYEC
jgi:transcriptional regulator with XRE-family HTH domain